MAIAYTQRHDGEWVDVTEERFFACCDCGLVHTQEYIIVGASVLRRVFREARATANRRRTTETKASIKVLVRRKKK